MEIWKNYDQENIYQFQKAFSKYNDIHKKIRQHFILEIWTIIISGLLFLKEVEVKEEYRESISKIFLNNLNTQFYVSLILIKAV